MQSVQTSIREILKEKARFLSLDGFVLVLAGLRLGRSLGLDLGHVINNFLSHLIQKCLNVPTGAKVVKRMEADFCLMHSILCVQ